MLINQMTQLINIIIHTIVQLKTTPVDVKPGTYTEFSKEINIGDIVRVSQYKNFFQKGYVPNSSEEVFAFKKVENAVHQKYVISDLKGK